MIHKCVFPLFMATPNAHVFEIQFQVSQAQAVATLQIQEIDSKKAQATSIQITP